MMKFNLQKMKHYDVSTNIQYSKGLNGIDFRVYKNALFIESNDNHYKFFFDNHIMELLSEQIVLIELSDCEKELCFLFEKYHSNYDYYLVSHVFLSPEEIELYNNLGITYSHATIEDYEVVLQKILSLNCIVKHSFEYNSRTMCVVNQGCFDADNLNLQIQKLNREVRKGVIYGKKE